MKYKSNKESRELYHKYIKSVRHDLQTKQMGRSFELFSHSAADSIQNLITRKGHNKSGATLFSWTCLSLGQREVTITVQRVA